MFGVIRSYKKLTGFIAYGVKGRMFFSNSNVR